MERKEVYMWEGGKKRTSEQANKQAIMQQPIAKLANGEKRKQENKQKEDNRKRKRKKRKPYCGDLERGEEGNLNKQPISTKTKT